MTCILPNRRRLAAVGCLVVCALCAVAQAQERSISGPATNEEIHALVRDLGDPVYATRVFASRRLCAIGSEAHGVLREAAGGDDVEAALRAKKLLATLDQVWFSGIEVRLDIAKRSFAWNEPVDLVVTLTNRSGHDARVPMETDPNKRDSMSADARQVADMLDVSEWLRVRGDGGREVELRVDEIADDSGVLSVVHERLDGGPSSVVPAGGQVTVRVRELNRGWARYPLLDAGEYSMVMEYAPEWLDPVLAANQVGRVTSNTLHVTVTRGAPETVSRGGAEAEIEIRRDGDTLVAMLTNRTDQTMFVNTNRGTSPPFAEERWVLEHDGRRFEIPSDSRLGRTWADFDEAGLAGVEAGASIELARIGVAQLRKALTDAGANVPPDGGTVVFGYVNLCNRQWQTREETNLAQDENAPAVLRRPLPRKMLSTRLSSGPLSAWGKP
jgi:hypothetical protein